MSRERDGIARLRQIADGLALTDEISYMADEVREIADDYEYLLDATEKLLVNSARTTHSTQKLIQTIKERIS